MSLINKLSTSACSTVPYIASFARGVVGTASIGAGLYASGYAIVSTVEVVLQVWKRCAPAQLQFSANSNRVFAWADKYRIARDVNLDAKREVNLPQLAKRTVAAALIAITASLVAYNFAGQSILNANKGLSYTLPLQINPGRFVDLGKSALRAVNLI